MRNFECTYFLKNFILESHTNILVYSALIYNIILKFVSFCKITHMLSDFCENYWVGAATQVEDTNSVPFTRK